MIKIILKVINTILFNALTTRQVVTDSATNDNEASVHRFIREYSVSSPSSWQRVSRLCCHCNELLCFSKATADADTTQTVPYLWWSRVASVNRSVNYNSTDGEAIDEGSCFAWCTWLCYPKRRILKMFKFVQALHNNASFPVRWDAGYCQFLNELTSFIAAPLLLNA